MEQLGYRDKIQVLVFLWKLNCPYPESFNFKCNYLVDVVYMNNFTILSVTCVSCVWQSEVQLFVLIYFLSSVSYHFLFVTLSVMILFEQLMLWIKW